MSVVAYTGEPVLPVELEREIFEIAARSRPGSIPTLVLVASRVKFWVEPFLYRTIILDEYTQLVEGYPALSCRSFPRVAQGKPSSLFRDSVRHLLLSVVVEGIDVHCFLTTCSQIENLFLMGHHRLPIYLPAIAALPLKRLHCNLDDLFPSYSQISFTHQLFSHLTHLWHLSHVGDPAIWPGLALLPHLTHLAFNSEDFIPLFLTFLDTCKSLRVLVHLQFSGADPPHIEVQLAEDTRFLSMDFGDIIDDWQIGAHTGIDFWSRAEDFVVLRKSGQIPEARQYRLGHDA
ncbi:hypothetical protein C8R43DRAFT_1112098 [Mycena crocata]|nr:hypothetical protein C8R43DRAFT_1112098 [Mycena crocata]